MHRSGTGADRGEVRAGDLQINGDVARNHVDDARRHEERRYAPRSAFMQRPYFLLDRADAADTGTNADADAVAVGIVDLQSGVAHGLLGRGDTVMDEWIGLADFLRPHPVFHPEAGDQPGELGAVGRHVIGRDRGYAAIPGNDVRPGGIEIGTDGRNNAHAGDDHAASSHGDDLDLKRGFCCAFR